MEDKKGTIYVAGPMRGIPRYNFSAFDAANQYLFSIGWDVINPANIDRDNGFDPDDLPEDTDWSKAPDDFNLREYFTRDTEALAQCDAIFMLAGWENSKGAKAEKACAEWLGLEVIFEQFSDAGAVCPLEFGVSGPDSPSPSPFPTDSKKRLEYPIFTGVLMYFADAMAAMARHSLMSFKQHNPNGKIGWDPTKSVGTLDQAIRHAMEAQIFHDAGLREKSLEEAAAFQWRATEMNQRLIKRMPPFDN